MPWSSAASSFASTLMPEVSSTSTVLPTSLWYWRRLLSSDPMPAEATVSEKSSSSRSNSSSIERLSLTQASMATEGSLSMSSSMSLPGVQVHPTTNMSVPCRLRSAASIIFFVSIIAEYRS